MIPGPSVDTAVDDIYLITTLPNLEGLDEGIDGLHGRLRVTGHVIGHSVRRPVLLEVGLEPQELPASLHETLSGKKIQNSWFQ